MLPHKPPMCVVRGGVLQQQQQRHKWMEVEKHNHLAASFSCVETGKTD